MASTPRDEMDSLLDMLLRQAQDFLQTHGEFYPFGATVTHQGEIQLAAAYTGSERPDSPAVIDLLYEGFVSSRSRGEIRATGICFDVRLRDRGQDAIQVALEHSEADPVNVFLPYVKGGDAPGYGELFATPGERRVFV